MSAQRSCKTARPACGDGTRCVALGWLAMLAVALGGHRLGAQEPKPAMATVGCGFVASMADDLRPLLGHEDPVLRGEAALALALTHDFEYYPAILEMARDPAAAARLRAIIALGLLGTPGAEAFLGRRLREAPREGVEQAAAALALALLPDDRPKPALHDYLRGIDSSYDRHRKTLTAWLVGIARFPHPSHGARLRAFLSDPSNREPSLQWLALRGLAELPGALARVDLSGWLEADAPRVRCGALEAMRRSTLAPEADTVAQVRRLAAHDDHPPVRAAALDLLVRWRQPAALDLAQVALRSGAPAEAAAAVRAICRLGGAELVDLMEAAILAAESAPVRAAMLAACGTSTSPDFQESCLKLAATPSEPAEVRVAAAVLLARSGDHRAAGVLAALFDSLTSPALLHDLATAMHALDPSQPTLGRIYPPRTVADRRLLPGRLAALFAADHDVSAVLAQALDSDALSPTIKAELLLALRTAVEPWDPELLAELPSALQVL